MELEWDEHLRCYTTGDRAKLKFISPTGEIYLETIHGDILRYVFETLDGRMLNGGEFASRDHDNPWLIQVDIDPRHINQFTRDVTEEDLKFTAWGTIAITAMHGKKLIIYKHPRMLIDVVGKYKHTAILSDYTLLQASL